MENEKSGMKISLNGPAFEEFKDDFDSALTDTITKMLKNGDSEGTVTGKIKISLENHVNDLGTIYIEPVFVHTVSGSVTQKCGIKGKMAGAFTLESDPESSGYLLKEPATAQTSMEDYAAGRKH